MCVELQIGGQHLKDGRVRQGTAVSTKFCEQIGGGFLLDRFVPAVAIGGMGFGDSDLVTQATMQIGGLSE